MIIKKFILQIIYRRLAYIARKVVKKYQPKVIAITGSVGKTSSKEAIAFILKQKFGEEVRCTSGNLNAEIGVPLTILGYNDQPKKYEWPLFLFKISKHLKEKKYPKYLIIEMGVERSGDIDYFCSIVKPDIAVITAATAAHIANFTSLEQMQKEKIKLSEFVEEDNLFFNADDKFLKNHLKGGHGYSISDSKLNIYASDIDTDIEGNKYLLHLGGEKIFVKNKLIGKQMIYADMAAAAVCYKLLGKCDDIIKSLNLRKPFLGRMNLLKGKKGIKIIDDTYNANPESVKAAALCLNEIKYFGRKVMILGDMNELGKSEKLFHKEVARHLNNFKNIDLFVFAGKNAKLMSIEIDSRHNVLVYKNRKELDRNILSIVKKNDLVLIKASQNNNYFEENVKILLDETIDPKENLVRQSESWLVKKN